ncbi:hypothetical protein LguiB_002001 [Lonicera macranthoides]
MKEFWKISHIRKKNDGDNNDDGLAVDGENGLRWVSKEAKKVHDDVEALQLQSLSENGVTLSYDEANARVTGPRAGYIRGRGAGPKPVSSSTRARDKEKDDARDKQLADAKKEADEARREADEARREADEANKKVENLQGQLDQFKKNMEAMVNQMMRNR